MERAKYRRKKAKRTMLNEDDISPYEKKIITIPNILSFFRLCLIPVVIWLYCFREDYLWSLLVLILSGITDMVDGKIARRFHMVSDFGKIIDPVADKLTQIAVIFCLASRFPMMGILFVVLLVKEILAGILNMITIKKTGQVTGALWHGKVCTLFLYLTMIIHLAWVHIPVVCSNLLAGLGSVLLLFSAGMYTYRNVKILMKK